MSKSVIERLDLGKGFLWKKSQSITRSEEQYQGKYLDNS